MPKDRWSPSEGGVCNNCGEPWFAHVEERCPDDERIEGLRRRIRKWHQRVDPARQMKDAARRHLKSVRNQHRKKWCDTDHLDRAEAIYEMSKRQYESMIRLADQKASRSHERGI